MALKSNLPPPLPRYRNEFAPAPWLRYETGRPWRLVGCDEGVISSLTSSGYPPAIVDRNTRLLELAAELLTAVDGATAVLADYLAGDEPDLGELYESLGELVARVVGE